MRAEAVIPGRSRYNAVRVIFSGRVDYNGLSGYLLDLEQYPPPTLQVEGVVGQFDPLPLGEREILVQAGALDREQIFVLGQPAGHDGTVVP